MDKCLETVELLQFLSWTGLDVTMTEAGILVHATAGDVLWFWTGTLWCWGL